MNPTQLLAHFDRFADAPDAVPRLRRFILDLAVRGKLVEQDPKDEPAGELLKRIQAEKAMLAKGGRIRKPEPHSPIDGADLPFPTLRGWNWERLATISRRIHYGYTASANKSISDVRLLRITDIQNNTVDWSSVPGCEIATDDVEQYRLEQGDILIARTGGTIGKTYLVTLTPVIAVFASYLIRVQASTELDSHYLKLFMESSVYWKQLADGSRGGGQPNVNGQTLGRMFVSIPPLAEQHRIVAKVDELLALCDRLEAAQTERENRRDRLVRASLNRLNQPASDPASFRDHAHFHLQHLPRIAARPEHIGQLRQTILNLAFRGMLVPQLPKEGTGGELLHRVSRIHPKDRRLGNNRKKQEAPIDPLNCPGIFDIPKTWSWSYLDFICEQIADVDHNMPKAADKGVPFISAKDLKDDGTIDFSDAKLISEADFVRLSRKVKICRHDIIYSRIGARLGKARLVEVDLRFLISYSCCLVRPLHDFVDKHYVQKFLDSKVALAQAHGGTQSIGVPDLGLGEIKEFRIPLPPLAEQHRIVAKVDELLALCDRLEAQLTTAQTESRRLLEAVLHEALAPLDQKAPREGPSS